MRKVCFLLVVTTVVFAVHSSEAALRSTDVSVESSFSDFNARTDKGPREAKSRDLVSLGDSAGIGFDDDGNAGVRSYF